MLIGIFFAEQYDKAYKLIMSLNLAACLLLTSTLSPPRSFTINPPLNHGSIPSTQLRFTICFRLARKNARSSSFSSNAFRDLWIIGRLLRSEEHTSELQ